MKKPNRKLTNELFEFTEKEIFHYTGGDYKPWWSPCDGGNLDISGYNSCSPSDLFFQELEKAVEDGRIIRKDKEGYPQDYLMEVHVKITKLQRISEEVR